MAKIVTLKDHSTGEYIYPTSLTKSIVDENGNSVDSILISLNEKIIQVSSAYKVLGVKDNFSEVTPITTSKIGDVWYIKNAFDLSDQSYPGGTSVLCIKDTAPGDIDPETHWLSLGTMFNLSEYVTKTEAKEFGKCEPINSALEIL